MHYYSHTQNLIIPDKNKNILALQFIQTRKFISYFTGNIIMVVDVFLCISGAFKIAVRENRSFLYNYVLLFESALTMDFYDRIVLNDTIYEGSLSVVFMVLTIFVDMIEQAKTYDWRENLQK